MTIRIASLLVLATIFCRPCATEARHHAAPSTGLPAIRFAQPPPDFAFGTTTSAQRLRQLVGRPVVLNFWASWCEPCRAETGAFAELQKTYGDGVALVTISEDRQPGAAEAYLQAHDLGQAVAVDDPDRKIFDLYSIVPIPTTLVLAPDGAVTHVSIGALDWDELRAAVAAVVPGGLTPPGAFGTVGDNASTRKP
jgi:thiol-disulfide isomerase/thioredoxin